MWHLEPAQLARFRAAVAHDVTGARLEAIVGALRAAKIDVSSHGELKTVPRGFPKEHPRADLLRHKGLVSWKDWPAGAWLGTAKAKARVVDFLHASGPLNDWLATHAG
jgi:uncharacterized protein (DUF2461 family)